MLSHQTSAPSTVPDAKRSLGPAGLLARVGVGLVFIYLAAFWTEVEWFGAVLGLVVMPAVVVAALGLRARHSPEPLSATGPIGHAVNLAIIVPLFMWPTTSGAAFLFYGTSMLLAAARRAGDCEVSAISNAVLKRDDQVGCPLFAPVDAVERAAAARRGVRGGREPGSTAPFAVAAAAVLGCAAIPLVAAVTGSITLAGVVAIAAGLVVAAAFLAPLGLRRSRHHDYERAG